MMQREITSTCYDQLKGREHFFYILRRDDFMLHSAISYLFFYFINSGISRAEQIISWTFPITVVFINSSIHPFLYCILKQPG